MTPPSPLAQAVSSFTVKCEELKTTTGTAPGTDIPFSDHEAVMATLHIRRQGQAAGDTPGTAGKVGGWWWGPPWWGGDWWSWVKMEFLGMFPLA